MNFKKLKKAKVSFAGKFIAATILGMSATFIAPYVCTNDSFRVFAEGKITTEIALQLMETHYNKNTKTLDLSNTDFTEIDDHAFAYLDEYLENRKIFKQIEEVILPPNCEQIGKGAFSGCEIDSTTRIICDLGSHLKKITIPSNIIAIDDEAFNNCYRLEDISFVNTQDTPSRLTHIGARAFSNTSIRNISIPNGCKQIGKECFKSCNELRSFYLNPEILSVPEGLCDGCWRLEKFSMGGKVTSIGDNAFSNCSNLKNFDIVTVTEVDGSEVRKIKSYNVENFELPENIESIGKNAFKRSQIENLPIPTSVVSLGEGVFSSSNLTSIELPKDLKFIPDKTFLACFNLSQVTVPQNISYIGEKCWEFCDNLKQVEILGKDIALGKNCIDMCDSLQIMCLPKAKEVTLKGPLISDEFTDPVIFIRANAKINKY